MSSLFSTPSVIDNDKLVAEKQRTIIQIKKKERKEKKRQERRDAESRGEEVEPESADEDEEEKEDADKMEVDAVEDEDAENPDLEDKYMSKLLGDDEDDDDDDEEDNDDEEKEDANEEQEQEQEQTEESEKAAGSDETTSTKEKSEAPTASAAKILDLKDKEFEKAERTIFIGNVPAVVMSNKRETKDFKKFINDFLDCPEHTNLTESIRFRSIHSTTNAPRKVAFISKEVDLENVMNSYVVFKKKEDSLRALKLNGVIYKDFHLRVDHLTHPTKKDNKLSVFVGNLDFQEKEETLWKYFNDKLIPKADRKTTKNVIENVRIVRDSKTSYGKGFAIVQFVDTNYVTQALLLDGKKMFNKRTLRITRCKKTMRNNETMRKEFSKLNDKQKTVVGRAKQLGKSDRHTLGKLVIEGERATKGKAPIGAGAKIGKQRHGGRKQRRENSARVTKRSQMFKEKAMAAEAAKPHPKNPRPVAKAKK